LIVVNISLCCAVNAMSRERERRKKCEYILCDANKQQTAEKKPMMTMAGEKRRTRRNI